MQFQFDGFIRCVLSVAILVAPLIRPLQIAAQQPDEAPVSQDELRDREKQRFDLIEELGKSVPRATFDPQVVVDQCGRDPVKLFTWISENTFLVPYRGLLRGHRGVLMDRRGNSLDRALLLAEFMRLSGQQVRLASAALSENQVDKVIAQSPQYPRDGIDVDTAITQGQVVANLKRFESIPGVNHRELLTILERHRLQRQQMAETALQRVVEQTPQLASLISKYGQPDTEHRIERDTRAAIRDHWWVQLKRGNAWIDCDPTMPGAVMGDAITPATSTVSVSGEQSTLADAIGADLTHSLDVRVVVERWEDGRLIEDTVLRQTIQPHQLSGEPIFITHAPIDWPLENSWLDKDDPVGSFKTQVTKQWEWFPLLLIGDQLRIESSFTVAGKVNPDAQASLQPPAVVGKAFGGLTDAFNDKVVQQMPAERNRPADDQLTAEWIEYVIRRPGKEVRTIRRPVFDLLGPAARRGNLTSVARPELTAEAALRRGLAVLGVTELLPLSHHISADFVRRLGAERELANRDPLLAALKPDASSTVYRSTPGPGLIYEFALARQHWNLHRHSVYLDQLNLLSFRNVVSVDANGQLRGGAGFDILANDVAMHPSAELDSFNFSIQQGVADTVLEAVLLGDHDDVSNTSTLFERTVGGAEAWVPVSDPGDKAFQEIDLSPTTRARIQQDLNDGFLVVIHDSGGSDEDTAVGWWRVDPSTGNTLGLMGSSRGEGYAEYIIITSLIMVCAVVAFFDRFIDTRPFTFRTRICVDVQYAPEFRQFYDEIDKARTKRQQEAQRELSEASKSEWYPYPMIGPLIANMFGGVYSELTYHGVSVPPKPRSQTESR